MNRAQIPSKPGLTRRVFSALGTLPLFANPATIAPAAARPETGVRFAAGDDEAQPLSILYNLSHADTPALELSASRIAAQVSW